MTSEPRNRTTAEKRGRPTLQHVAAAVGVTSQTVSNVLNGRNGEVGAETRERIKVAAKRLGYRPNVAARQLRSRKTNAIGLLVLDDVPEFLNDPFTTQLAAGLANFASEHDYSLVLQGVRSDNMLEAPIVAQLQTDGVCSIMSGSARERRALIERVVALDVPLVLIQEPYDHPSVCSVRQDDRYGARLIAERLIMRGSKRLMFLAPSEEWPAIIERHRGTRDVCDEHGATLQVVTCGDESLAPTQRALAVAIDASGLPDAIVGGNDRMALAALKLLASRGIEVPCDVCVTGFNGFDMSTYAVPSLVTVRSAAYDMGYRAGRELLTALKTGDFATRNVVLPVTLVDGQSA